MSYKFIYSIFLCSVFFLACEVDKNAKVNKKTPLIVTTTAMIGDMVKTIGGDSVEVISLMGSGVDPHLYKATHGDLQKLRTADLIVYNGLKLEGKLSDILTTLSNQKAVLAVGDIIPDSLLLDDPNYEGNPDPHIWFDINLWSLTSHAVEEALIELDSASQEYYKQLANAYRKELETLDREVRNKINEISENQRHLITAHDAFHYFGRAYNIKVRGLQGISTLSEFGLRDRIDLVNFIVEKKIKAVFVESSVPKKNIESIIKGVNKEGHTVIIGGELYSDAMGPKGTKEGTYIGMVRHNVDTIVRSLK